MAKELVVMADDLVTKGKVHLIEMKVDPRVLVSEDLDVVCTVPAGLEKPKMREVWFQLWCHLKGRLKLLKNRNYVYLLDKNTPIYRITRVGLPQLIVTESLEEADMSSVGFEELARMKAPVQISKPVPPPEDMPMYFVGRFATSNSEYMFHDALADLFQIRSAIRRKHDKSLGT